MTHTMGKWSSYTMLYYRATRINKLQIQYNDKSYMYIVAPRRKA